MSFRTLIERFGGLFCLVLGIAAAFAIGQGFSQSIGITLATDPKCTQSSAPTDLSVFASRSHWTAMVVLEAVVATFAVAMSVACVAEAVKCWRPSKNAGVYACMGVGMAALVCDAYLIWGLRDPTHVRAFLSQLLASLPPQCDGIRTSVTWARMIGEVAGFELGIAMTVILSLHQAPTPSELSRRHRLLKQLLYLASLLFVVGVMMSRANFDLVVAQWRLLDEPTAKATESVVTAGVVQSGVAYSALLVAFYAPARGLLAFHVRKTMPSEFESSAVQLEAWLKNNGLGGTWQDDARQILAIVAPILSAPIFDAVTKL